MPRLSALLLGFLLLALSACAAADAAPPPDTTTTTTPSTSITTSTSATPTSTASTPPPPETTTAATTATTTTAAVTASGIEAVVVWDGANCRYEGPETAPVGSVIAVTFRNDGEVPADLEIDYLGRGVFLEAGIAAWPSEVRTAEDYPDNTYPIANLPEWPASVDPGGEVSADVTLVIARPHTFICFSGGTLAVVQSIDVATDGLTATDN